MADGGLTIELDASLSARLRDAAEAAGQSADEFAACILAEALAHDWASARASLADYDRTGEFADARQALAVNRDRLVARLNRAR
jgi:hypothetical protein